MQTTKTPTTNRRSFIRQTGLGVAGVAVHQIRAYSEPAKTDGTRNDSPYQFVLFTDNLADLSVTEACREINRIGFDGLDLTVRPGGHVLPENVVRELPVAKRIAAGHGLALPMISTAITDIDSPHAEAIMETAAAVGVKKIKLGYWRYRPFGTALQQLDSARSKMERIAKLAGRYGVLPCVHVHSGDQVTAGGGLLYLILKDFTAQEAGAYVDPMHMSVEGALGGWQIGLDLLTPWVALVGIKNYRWRDDADPSEPRVQYTTLDSGMAPLKQFMGYIRQMNYRGPISLHSEYKGRTSFRRLTSPELLQQSKADLIYLKSIS